MLKILVCFLLFLTACGNSGPREPNEANCVATDPETQEVRVYPSSYCESNKDENGNLLSTLILYHFLFGYPGYMPYGYIMPPSYFTTYHVTYTAPRDTTYKTATGSSVETKAGSVTKVVPPAKPVTPKFVDPKSPPKPVVPATKPSAPPPSKPAAKPASPSKPSSPPKSAPSKPSSGGKR